MRAYGSALRTQQNLLAAVLAVTVENQRAQDHPERFAAAATLAGPSRDKGAVLPGQTLAG